MTRLPPLSASEQPALQLKQFFHRNAYVRVANQERIETLGWRKYKKGYEVRLVLRPDELPHVRQLIQQVGFKAGKPFAKGKRVVQPIYGKAAVEWFLSKKLK